MISLLSFKAVRSVPGKVAYTCIFIGLIGVGQANGAQAGGAGTTKKAHRVGQVVEVPGVPLPVYVVPVENFDTRTPAQRCWDFEVSKAEAPLSDLARRTIELKCSQR